MEKVKPEPELRLTMLLHDIGKPNCFTVDGLGCGHFYGHPAESARMAEAMLGRLRAETVLRETVVQLVAWHDRNIPRTRPGVARALGALGERDLRRLLDVKRADNLAQAPAYRFLPGGDRQGGMHPGPAAGGGRLRIPAAAGGERAGPAGHGTLRPRGGTDFAGTAERCAG